MKLFLFYVRLSAFIEELKIIDTDVTLKFSNLDMGLDFLPSLL
jgi:hypothetical protein